MKIKFMLLALLPAGPLFAQEIHHPHDEDNEPLQVRIYQEEVKQLQRTMLGSSLLPHNSLQLRSSAEGPDMPQAYLDYFPAALFLRNEVGNGANAPASHEYSIRTYRKASLMLDGVSYTDLDCHEISDQYRITNKAGIEYQYHNTYFHYTDPAGNDVATLIYIESTAGFLRSEKKLVKKAMQQVLTAGLDIVPNPASGAVKLQLRIAQPGMYSVSITDINGRVVYRPLTSQMLQAGTQHISLNPVLAPGTYFVSLQSDQCKPLTQKLIIQ